MKFLKYVSYSIEYLCSEVQLPASPLCFLSHSVAVAALSEISHVACRALDDSFWVFLSPTMQEPHRPPNNIFWALIQEKMIILSPFHSKAIVLLYKFETSWTFLGGRPWPGVKFFFFCHLRGLQTLLFMNLLQSYLVGFPLLYMAFFKTILVVSFKTFGLTPPSLLFSMTILPPNFRIFPFF